MNQLSFDRRILSSVAVACLLPYSGAWTIPLPGGSRVSFNDGILRIGQPLPLEIPPADATISESILQRIKVRDTGHPLKGFGAFCVNEPIPQHSFLGFYPDTTKIVRDLDRPALEEPLVDNGGDYLLAIDGGMTFLDGYERAQDRTVFSPVHLNHKDAQGCNCVRVMSDKRVAFFTKRDIQVGEELCFDYGSNFWRGRQDKKI